MSKSDRDWKEYNAKFARNGSVTFWFCKEYLEKWCYESKQGTHAHPKVYTDDADHTV
jgi:hypothetical protein